ncbi:MAG TPA: hypothetical protein VM452_12395, partial [Caulifigura sp.]|nr:hypothetical protein [Caulifigura sp.]
MTISTDLDSRRPTSVHSIGRLLCLAALMAAMAGVVINAPASALAQDAPPDNPFPGRFPAPSLDGGVEWLNTSG